MLMLVGVLLTTAPCAVQAQAGTARMTSQREMALERRDAMRARREAQQALSAEERAAMTARREARFNAMPADQQQFVREMRSYTQGLREKSHELRQQVKTGALSGDAMAQQLQAYRDANKPVRPAGMPERKRTP
jgi:hypothetical protein